MQNVLFTLIVWLMWGCSSSNSKDPYKNFAQLKNHEVSGKDFIIEKKMSNFPILIMAIHGCQIEPGTSELAQSIAGKDLNFYNFCGKKTEGLHITSTNFDEPGLIEMTMNSQSCLSIHGYRGDEADFCLGGRDDELRKVILEKLRSEFPQFTTCDLCCPPLLGLAHKNPVNRCQNQGVQIEMSPRVRRTILENSSFKQRLSILLREALVSN